MPPSYVKLRDAYREGNSATIITAEGIVYDAVAVKSFTRVVTDYFEVWRFTLWAPGGEVTLYGPDLEDVEVYD